MNRISIFFALLLCSSGCDRPSENRAAPTNGFRDETVEFDTPNPGARRHSVPEAVFGELTAEGVPLELSPGVQGRPIAFEGLVSGVPAPAIPLVIVVFYRTDSSGKRIITNEFNVPAVVADDGQAFAYRAEGEIPETRGRNNVEIHVINMHPDGPPNGVSTDATAPTIIATGQIDVQ